jgi:CheY-like chemotaxis protein
VFSTTNQSLLIKELDELKNQFIANISHELRTPLALILGPTQKLLDLPIAKSEEILQKSLETILLNAHTLLKHVNDLLEISKLEAGKLELCYYEVNFPDLIKRICSYFELQANNRSMEFEIICDGSWQSQVDVDKIERIVLNLLSNAFKFTPENSRVQVTINHHSPAEHQPQGLIELIVEDSGPGIKEELWNVIFDRFQQGEGSTKRNYGGTGLGLAIVKELTTLHGGTVCVGRSQSLGGALLKIQLPLLAPAGTKVMGAHEHSKVNNNSNNFDIRDQVSNFARQTLAELSSNSKAPNPKAFNNNTAGKNRDDPLVLVVEDNQAMNQFIVEALENHYRVITAFNGEQGLAQVIEHNPDCVISDVMMPVMSGDELVAQIRSRSELDSIPIIMLTAKADDELKVSVLRNGVQDYLSKPFNAEDLLARVNNLVTMRQTWLAMQQTLSVQQRNIKELIDDITAMFNHDSAMKNLLGTSQKTTTSD